MSFTTLSETGMKLDSKALKAELAELLADINSDLPTHERLSKIFVTPPWTMENELLTPTMKIKRKQIEAFYKEKLANYSGKDTVVFLS